MRELVDAINTHNRKQEEWLEKNLSSLEEANITEAENYEFQIFHDEEDAYWTSQLSEKGNASYFGKDLRIFSLSCETMDKEKNLLPVNLFLHF